MKSKVIYVDFINKAKKSTPFEKSDHKNLLVAIWQKIKSTFIFNCETTKNINHSYTFKNMI